MFINRYLQIRRIICAGLKGEKKRDRSLFRIQRLLTSMFFAFRLLCTLSSASS